MEDVPQELTQDIGVRSLARLILLCDCTAASVSSLDSGDLYDSL